MLIVAHIDKKIKNVVKKYVLKKIRQGIDCVNNTNTGGGGRRGHGRSRLRKNV